MNRRHAIQLALTGIAASQLAVPRTAAAQSGFPASGKPVSIYVPYSPGGSIDVSTRALATAAEPHLGTTILVVNRPGAGGSIAANSVARSEPDGYTLAIVAPSNLTITPQIQTVAYDPFKDFTPVSTFGATTIYLVVGRNSRFRTLQDLIEHARSKPREVLTAITSIGAGTHLSMSRLMRERGVEMEYVTFGGGAKIVTALMGGHVEVACVAGEALPSILSGDLRILAGFSRDRLPAIKDSPTIQDSGSTWEPDSWIGLAGPAGLPDAIRRKLEQSFLQATYDARFLHVLAELAMTPKRLTSASLTETIGKSFADNANLIRQIGLGGGSKPKS